MSSLSAPRTLATPCAPNAVVNPARYSGARPLADECRFVTHPNVTVVTTSRGGRYDHIGQRFGRARPATGFSLDLREITELLPCAPAGQAISAPWTMDVALRAAVAELRAAGEVVIQVSEHQAHEEDAFVCDRELVLDAGQWVVRVR